MGKIRGETGWIWEGRRGHRVDHGKMGRQNGLEKVRGKTGWIWEDKRGDRRNWRR